MQCPFCNNNLSKNSSDIKVEKCEQCPHEYCKIKTCTDDITTKIVAFCTKKYKIETYDNDMGCATKIQHGDNETWIYEKLKISNFDPEKIDNKIDCLITFK